MKREMIEVREDRESDIDAIRAVHDTAFGRTNEGRLVASLRADGEIVASIVALVNGEVVGNAVFSRLPLWSPTETLSAVALAPVAVLPALQRRGVASAMIRHGLDLCTGRGYVAALVLGDPRYYTRFGFSHDTAKTVGSRYARAGEAWMAMEIRARSLANRTQARYPRAFAVVD